MGKLRLKLEILAILGEIFENLYIIKKTKLKFSKIKYKLNI